MKPKEFFFKKSGFFLMEILRQIINIERRGLFTYLILN